MATKKKPTKRKITVIFESWVTLAEDAIVEFEANTFTLICEGGPCPMWSIINEDPADETLQASNVFLKQSEVLAIGFTDDMQPMIKSFKKQIKAIKVTTAK